MRHNSSFLAPLLPFSPAPMNSPCSPQERHHANTRGGLGKIYQSNNVGGAVVHSRFCVRQMDKSVPVKESAWMLIFVRHFRIILVSRGRPRRKRMSLPVGRSVGRSDCKIHGEHCGSLRSMTVTDKFMSDLGLCSGQERTLPR